MINVRLSGGLGNQLFQLVCALRYSENDPTKLRLYSEALGEYNAAREFELSKICDLDFASVKALPSLILKYRLAKFLNNDKFFINDKNYYLNTNVKNSAIIFLDGYFQYEQSWEIIAPSVQFIKNKINKKISTTSTGGLVVHARGGDFLGNDLSHQHQITFYKNVLKNNKLAGFNSGILCCSDPSYGAKIVSFFQLHGINLSYEQRDDNDWQDDFQLLMNAEFVVGSRSTFAWWATLFGETRSIFPFDFTISHPRELFHPCETSL